MRLDINDIILVCIKAFGHDRKVVDKWEQNPYRVVEQLPNQPVCRVQSMEDHTKIRTLHCNMLYPLKTVHDEDESMAIVETVRPVLDRANKVMETLFNST